MPVQLAVGGWWGGGWMQAVGLLGAVLVLLPYAALQMGRVTRESRAFNASNAIGAALLTWVAIEDRRLGFILLEGTWTLLSLVPLVRGARGG